MGDTWPNEDAVLFSIQRKPTDPKDAPGGVVFVALAPIIPAISRLAMRKPSPPCSTARKVIADSIER